MAVKKPATMQTRRGSIRISIFILWWVYARRIREPIKIRYPVKRINTDFKTKEAGSRRIKNKIPATGIPREMDNAISRIRKRTTPVFQVNPVKRASAVVIAVANSTMTTTSMMTVTPMTVFVNRPLALSSLIMAMAEDGLLTTRMAPAISATPTLPETGMAAMKVIWSARAKNASEPIVKVEITSPDVIQPMAVSLDLSSFR